ncbi:MAG: efflux RND transporter periplasmic adaptor subunit [bacterium]|nr:efflux RND transporter periplasmic adaptor subunit [bacterium]
MFSRITNFALIGSLLGVISFFSCSEETVQQEEIIRPVRYQKIYSTGGERIRSFSGVAQAGQESRLSFKVPGTISRLAVRVGERVRKGNVIAELDKRDFELRVRQANDALEQAKAQERLARSTYDRVRGLFENNNASRSDLDNAKSASDAAAASLRSAQRALEIAELQRSYTTLSAPVDGTISSVDVEVNENASAGQIIAALTSGTRMEVTVGIPEVLIAEIREGGRVTVRFGSIPNKDFQATITEVAVSTTMQLATYPVTVRLDRQDDAIRPSMAADVDFSFETQGGRERFLVPGFSVGEDDNGRFVFIVMPNDDGTGMVQRKTVTVGDLISDGYEILEGLQDGDLVVTAGVSKIRDGQKVKLLAGKEK